MKFDFNEIYEKIKYNPNSVKKNYDGKTDVYLAKASYRYGYFKTVLSLILVFVVALFLLSGTLTYDKLFYLAKDIKLANDYVNSVHDTITYNVGNSQVFASYRGGLAVASRERLSIFSAGGRELFSATHSYGNPTLATSSKYVLLYDVGGKQFSLYNSFSKMSEEKLDYAIYGASMCENGDFAIITQSEKFDSVVKVYKQNGTTYNYNFSSGHVCSVALSQNGSQMAVLLTFSNNTEMISELRLYNVGKDSYTSANISYSGVPYAVNISDGNIFVVGSRGINIFSSNLTMIGEYLTNSEIYLYAFGEDNIAVAYLSDNGGKTRIALIDKRGNIEREYQLNERPVDIALYKNSLFWQELAHFKKVDLKSDEKYSINLVATDFKMIVIDKDTIVVCNDSYAKFLEFSK